MDVRHKYLIKIIKAIVTRWLASSIATDWQIYRSQFKQRLFHNEPIAEVYLALTDPYSYLLVQVLPELEQRFNVSFKIYFVAGTNHDISANNKLWQQWAKSDVNQLAKRYQLDEVTQYPSVDDINTGQQEWQLLPKTVANAVDVFHKTWQKKYDDIYALSTPVINALLNNQEKQKRRGHYLPATIRFMNQWYWGLDRLSHFETLLNQQQVNKINQNSHYLKTQLQFVDIRRKPQEIITVYISLRSPYSYLGLIQVKKLASHYRIKLDVKLVMPMIMRGLSVSRLKQKCIFVDAAREAKAKGIPLYKFADPIGQGVLNGYQFFYYAKYCQCEIDYLLALFKAVYVDGVDLSKIRNVKKIVEQVGLDYDAALHFSKHNPWRADIDENEKYLFEKGFWGVPVFEYRELSVWGQDRLWQIEQAIIDLNDN